MFQLEIYLAVFSELSDKDLDLVSVHPKTRRGILKEQSDSDEPQSWSHLDFLVDSVSCNY